ncbi:MAG: ABC-F family ATP-binding cassette domain-containing protein [Rhodococcus sp.]|nr:ABC-F family ATP-binding cassette domain-containing protein [Rhodococcus sp. (in: high G+C Gram-positive bacteria)]
MSRTSRARSAAHITARELTLSRFARTIVRGLNLTVSPESKIALVGENGAGKSTVLSALAGTLEPSSGEVSAHGRIAVAEQELSADNGRTVDDAVDFAIRQSRAALKDLDRAAEELSEGLAGADDHYAEALDRATAIDAWNAELRVSIALESLGAETRRDRPLRELSVGQRYRVRLACLLGGDAEILLLDEPTNHLDAHGLDFLTASLTGRNGGFVVVSHDRRLLADVAETFVDLDPSSDGRPRVYGGGYSAYLTSRAAETARWEQLHAGQTAEADRLRGKLSEAQSRLSTGWRPEKGTGKHQRASRAPGVVQAVKRRQEELDAHTVAAPEPPKRLMVPDYKVSVGGTLLAADEVTVEGRLRTPVTFALSAGDRLLVRGPNGAGKSTLLSALTGRLEPSGGRVHCHSAAKIGVLTQESESDVPTLSMGQQRRRVLAGVLAEHPDVLILDEPTNHLSVAAVDDLTEALESMNAAVVVATHDRVMLDAYAHWPTVTIGG